MSAPRPEKEIVEIVYILDRSASMQEIKKSAIDGFNEFVQEQKNGDGFPFMSLVLFDDRIETPFTSIPVREIRPIDGETYWTRGTTALLDAIGSTIKKLKADIKKRPPQRRPSAVIVAIFTDGEENASEKYSIRKVSRMIRKAQDKDGWEFLFLAANQDAIATASKIHIPASNTSDITFTGDGMISGYRAASRKTHMLRTMKLGQRPDPPAKRSLQELVNDEET